MNTYKDEAPVMDVAIWELPGKEKSGKYQLAISIQGGGSITFGSQYTTKAEARAALRTIRGTLAGIGMEYGFSFMRAVLSKLDKHRLSEQLLAIV